MFVCVDALVNNCLVMSGLSFSRKHMISGKPAHLQSLVGAFTAQIQKDWAVDEG